MTAITFVLRAVDQMRRQIVCERDIAVRTFSEIVTVDPNLTVAIDAVKVDEDLFPLAVHGHRECLAIPAEATGQRAAAGAGRGLFTELAFDTPVVRQIQLPPLSIVETRVLHVRDIAKLKAPILVEGDFFTGSRIGEAE